MAKIICLKIKRRGDFFRLGAQILRRFMGFYSLISNGDEASSVKPLMVISCLIAAAIL